MKYRNEFFAAEIPSGVLRMKILLIILSIFSFCLYAPLYGIDEEASVEIKHELHLN